MRRRTQIWLNIQRPFYAHCTRNKTWTEFKLNLTDRRVAFPKNRRLCWRRVPSAISSQIQT